MHKILHNHQKPGLAAVPQPGVSSDNVSDQRYRFSQLDKRPVARILAAFLVFFSLLFGNFPLLASDPDERNAEFNPIVITTAQQLDAIRNDLAGDYELGADIDLSGFSNWQPIGTLNAPFIGTLNGKGYKISGLTINRPSDDFVGLFGYVSGGDISFLGLEVNSITGRNSVGGIAGHIQGSVNPSTLITTLGKVTTAYVASGEINGSEKVGGLVGSMGASTEFGQTYSTVRVNGGSTGSKIGGLVGEITYGTGSSTIQNSYSAGQVIGASQLGGFIGHIDATDQPNLLRNFWDTEASGQATSSGTSGVVGKTTAEMRQAGTFSEWGDFSDPNFPYTIIDRERRSSYPYLKSVNTDPFPGFFLDVTFGGGDGSVGNPYLIQTPDHLNDVKYVWDKNFRLENDINLNTAPYNQGAGWSPIGAANPNIGFSQIGDDVYFTGVFDGNNYKITGLTIDNPTGNDVGLFGVLAGDAVVKNLGLEDFSVTGNARVGSFAGGMRGSSKIEKSYAANGNVNGGTDLGGLVGRVFDNTVRISQAYTLVEVVGGTNVGGIIGNGAVDNLDQCYSASQLSGTSNIRGLIGSTSSTVPNSYFDVDAATGDRFPRDNRVTTAEMKTKSTFVNWDFDNTWQIEEGLVISYPYLRNVVQDPPPGLEELFAGGNGDSDNPYQITDWYQLSRVRDFLDKHFILIADLDEDSPGYEELASATANGGKGWQPIGSGLDSDDNWTGDQFTGSFNGNNHKIKSLKINRPDDEFVGLFVTFSENTITKNFQLEGEIIGCSSNSGMLVGENFGIIDNIHVSVQINSNAGRRLGGLVGLNWNKVINSSTSGIIITNDGHTIGGLIGFLKPGNSSVLSSSSSVNITAKSQAGGLVGQNGDWDESGGKIEKSFATGNVVITSMSAGGLIGSNYGEVKLSYATGDISVGSNNAGGFVGENYGKISNSYANGDVGSGEGGEGGFVGYNFPKDDDFSFFGDISYSYSTGYVEVSDPDEAGGFLGYGGGDPKFSFWDIETSGMTTSTGATGLTTAEMQTLATFTVATWDFDDIWTMEQGSRVSYPYFGTLAQDPLPGVEVQLLGAGTDTDPYQITDWYQLDEVRNRLDKYFILKNDLDETSAGYAELAAAAANDGKGWEPIGDNTNRFVGTFDGDGKTISELVINRPEERRVGLFGYIGEGSVIQNLGLVSPVVTGQEQVGSLVGQVWLGSVSNCYATDVEVISSNFVDKGEEIGGLIGASNGIEIFRSYATGVVKGPKHIGGLVGSINSANDFQTQSTTISSIRESYANVSVAYDAESFRNSYMYFGGLVGVLSGTNIYDSFAMGSVSGSLAGGLIGVAGDSDPTLIARSYSIGEVTGEGFGGFIGEISNEGGLTIEHSFWDVTTSGTTRSTGKITNNTTGQAAVGKTTEEMQELPTFGGPDAANRIWDVVAVDGLESAYPTLQWTTEIASSATWLMPKKIAITSVTAEYDNFLQDGGTIGQQACTSCSLDFSNGELTFTVGDPTELNAGSSGIDINDYPGYRVGEVVDGGTELAGLIITADQLEVTQDVTWEGFDIILRSQGDIRILAEMTARGADDRVILEYGQAAVAADNESKYEFGLGEEGFSGKINLQAGDNFSTKLGSDGTAVDWTVITALGIEGDEYEEDAVNSLQGLAYEDRLTGNYVLGADIDASSTSSWDSEQGFVSIGFDNDEFEGNFDGLGHEITNLTINRTSTNRIGLFGDAKNSFFSNVMLNQANIKGYIDVGMLVGRAKDFSLKSVLATGMVEGEDYVGGLIGEGENCLVYDSHAKGDVKGEDTVGGLIGYLTGNVLVARSSAMVDVSGEDYIGGLIGEISNVSDKSEVKESFASGTVRGRERTGGLIGEIYTTSRISINKSYYEGDGVDGEDYVGGLIGQGQNVLIEHSTASGPVSGIDVSGNEVIRWVGGLIGYLEDGDIQSSHASGNVTANGDYVGGLIGLMYGGQIQSSHASGEVTAEGGEYIGGLVGEAENLTVYESYSLGNVSGDEYVGGLFGRNINVDLEKVRAEGDVSAGDDYVGGLIGESYGGSIKKSYATGNVISSGDDVGGLIGYAESYEGEIEISQSYATGDVSGDVSVGGFIGRSNSYTYDLIISNSFTFGKVTGEEEIGGFIGKVRKRDGHHTISNSFATGVVTGTDNTDNKGGLIGYLDGVGVEIENSFWDIETSGLEESAGGEGKTTAEMQALSTYLSEESPWEIDPRDANELDSPYPVLTWTTDLESEGIWIIARNLSEITVEDIPDQVYTGLDIEPTLVVKNGDQTLSIDSDFTLTFADNISLGTAQVTINAVEGGRYLGTATARFEIVARQLEVASQELELSKAYDGKLTALIDSIALDGVAEGEDVTVTAVATYDDTQVGTDKTITVVYTLEGEGSENYLAPEDFVTSAGEITNSQLTIASQNLILEKVFDGTDVAAISDIVLVGVFQEDDLELSAVATYDNANAGEGKQITVAYSIRGDDSGNYTAPKDFVVETGVINSKILPEQNFGIADQSFTGSELTVKLTVNDGDITLKEGVDYEITYSDNIDTGKATVTVTGIGNYGGTLSENFAITARSLDNAEVVAMDAQTFTGSALTPAVTLLDGSLTLVEGTDFTVSYSDNTNAGTATVAVTGIGNYAGTLSAGFEISKIPVRVRAVDQERNFGEENPVLDFVYEGLLPGTDRVVVEPVASTEAAANSLPGTYPIVLKGGSDPNYSLTLLNGVLTVVDPYISPVQNLEAQVDDKEISISWEVPAESATEILGYRIEVSLDGISYEFLTETEALEYVAKDLANSQKYWFRISAFTAFSTGEEKVIGPLIPIAPVTDNNNTIPTQDPGTFTLSSDENEEEVFLDIVDDALVFESGSLAMELAASRATGDQLPILEGQLLLEPDGLAEVSGEGFRENTAVAVWLIQNVDGNTGARVKVGETYLQSKLKESDALLRQSARLMGTQAGAVYFLGYADVDDLGNFIATMDIPGDIKPGRYTLQATGITQGGSTMALNLGAILIEDSDLDSDGDGVPDVYEYMQGTNPFNKDEFRDSNSDGVPDYVRDRSPVEYYSPGAVQVSWGSPVAAAGLPEEVVLMNGGGEVVILKVTWDISTVNAFSRGNYMVNGTLELPKGVFNAYELIPDIEVVILPKPVPADILLSNNSFEGARTSQEVAIGSLSVEDPVDSFHVLGVPFDLEDNRYFSVINDVLYWSGEDPAAGRTSFKVVVRVTDRDFNTLDRVFEITRLRKRVEDIEIFNTFTPNGDGINETWGIPELRYYRGARIQVFERSGERVFYTEDPDQRWDGTFNGKELPVGTYYWVLEVRETGEVRKGMLNLLRK